ncbi:MAG: hypothetical protein ABWY94_01765 [Pseudoxanthomonas sp.]
MNANNKIADPLRGLSRLVRPHYSPGLLLQDDDLTQAVDYTRELSRVLFRSFFGCGVICGLEVKAYEECGKLHVDIAKGIGLDCHGDPVEVPALQTLLVDPTCGPKIPDSFCVVLRRNERCCAPRTAICGDEEEPAPVCTREREGFEIRISAECPECGCGCQEQARTPAPPPPDPAFTPAPAAPPAAARLIAKKKTVPARAAAAPLVESSTVVMQTLDNGRRHDCRCADPTRDCYVDHYAGKCACDCCDSEWIVLAKATRSTENNGEAWRVDHSVRRFIRPVLMADPLVPAAERVSA